VFFYFEVSVMVDLTNPFEAIENPTPEEILIVFAVGK